jgi:hypothetical protein
VANFVRRLKKGTEDRWKGKLPLICFNCDGIGHLLTNVLIRKIKELMKMIKTENKHIKEKEQKRKSSRNIYSPKKTTPHQMKMKSVKVRHKEFYSWQ